MDRVSAVSYLVTVIRRMSEEEDRVRAWARALDARPLAREDVRPLVDGLCATNMVVANMAQMLIVTLGGEEPKPAPSSGMLARLDRLVSSWRASR